MSAQKLFKIIDNDLIKDLNISTAKSYYYFLNGEIKPLIEKKLNPVSSSEIYKIEDETRKWTELRDSQSMFINVNVTIHHIEKLFYGSARVAFSDSILGVGLEWKPKNSKIKKCVKLGTVDKTLDDFSKNITLEIKYPNNNIEFYWFIYVIKPGKQSPELNERIGNIEGLILGKNLLWSIVVEGNGSIFPIEECYKPEEPLWSIRCCFNEWSVDDFSQENVAIILNKAHPLYPLVEYNGDQFDISFFKEIISSALSALITQIVLVAKEQNTYDELFKDPFEENGTILEAIRYFKNSSLHFEVGSMPLDLIQSVKIAFEKEKSL